MRTDKLKIRALNDEARSRLPSGGAIITMGIVALGAEAVLRLIQTIAVFDDFCQENDPHGEHDFGHFKFDGEVDVFFKIDYYDKSMKFASPDPSDPSVTERVITIMTASEY